MDIFKDMAVNAMGAPPPRRARKPLEMVHFGPHPPESAALPDMVHFGPAHEPTAETVSPEEVEQLEDTNRVSGEECLHRSDITD